MTIVEADITPSSVDLNSDWQYESNALSDDGQYAFINTSVSTPLKIHNFTTTFEPSVGEEYQCIGIEIDVDTWMCNQSGLPISPSDVDPARLRVQLSKDGTVMSSDSELVDCRASGVKTVGGSNTIFGLDSLSLSEILNDQLYICLSVPIDLVDESIIDLYRSIDFVSATIYLVDSALRITLLDAQGTCGGDVELTYEET